MKLSVTERTATITGIGFSPDIAEAFASLLGEWKAAISLSRDSIQLEPGIYSLALIGKDLYASRGEEKLFLPVGPVEVEVFSARG